MAISDEQDDPTVDEVLASLKLKRENALRRAASIVLTPTEADVLIGYFDNIDAFRRDILRSPRR